MAKQAAEAKRQPAKKDAPGAVKHRADPVEPLRRVEPHEAEQYLESLARTRARRWAELRRSFPAVRPDLADWAERMEAAHGPKVKVGRNVLDWITALYVVRYGENEAYWPEALTDGDASRALQWERGTFAPDNTRYLMED